MDFSELEIGKVYKGKRYYEPFYVLDKVTFGGKDFVATIFLNNNFLDLTLFVGEIFNHTYRDSDIKEVSWDYVEQEIFVRFFENKFLEEERFFNNFNNYLMMK